MTKFDKFSPALKVGALLTGLLLGIGLTILISRQATQQNRPPQAQVPETVPQKSEPLGPSDVVRTYWQLSTEGKIEEAKELLTNYHLSIGRPEPPNNWFAKFIHGKKYKLIRVEREFIEDDQATVIVSATSEMYGDHVFKWRHLLYKNQGKWKISSTT